MREIGPSREFMIQSIKDKERYSLCKVYVDTVGHRFIHISSLYVVKNNDQVYNIFVLSTSCHHPFRILNTCQITLLDSFDS